MRVLRSIGWLNAAAWLALLFFIRFGLHQSWLGAAAAAAFLTALLAARQWVIDTLFHAVSGEIERYKARK